MANLPESAAYDSGIYQIETTDAVIGGVNGISNLAAKGLANRTTWLKQQVDALNLQKGIGTPDFSAASSYNGGQQVIYQKNIWQANTAISPGAFNSANWTRKLGVAAESALADAVPLMSGTAAIGTSTDLAREDHVHPSDTTRLAVSALATQAEALAGTDNSKWMSPLRVAQVGGAVITSISASRTLLAAEMGLVLVDATAAAVTITLPVSNGTLGIRDVIIRRQDNSANRLVIQAGGTDKIKFHTHLATAGYLFFVLMGAGDWWRLRSDGAGNWWPIGRYDNTALGKPTQESTSAINPGGWGLLNGLVYNRAEWPWLWDHAQASGMLTTEAARAGMEGGWTSGDGSLTFRSPEGRGEFFRVFDDSRGIDSGRVAGSSQLDAMQGHRHAALSSNFINNGALNTAPGSSFAGGINVVTTTGNPVNDTVNGAPRVASETRGRNIAYPGRIKMI